MPYSNTKAEKLMALGKSVLNDSMHREELQQIMKRLNFNEPEILKAYVDFDLDLFSMDNDIYKPLLVRFVLYMHNLLQGSWHIEKQQYVSHFIKQAKPTKVIDVGFGVPSFYIKECLSSSSFSLTLCDNSPLAFSFAKELLDLWKPTWPETIKFLLVDMMDVPACVGDYDLYMFQDSIEHVKNPTECLTRFVSLSRNKSQFLLSLPLGPIIPIHTIAWNDQEEALKWLIQCGLQPRSFELVRTNPEVDLFASEIEEGFTEYIVLCDKMPREREIV